MKYALSAAAIIVLTIITGLADDSETDINHSKESATEVPDTLTVSDYKEQIAAVLPDTTAVPDSLLFKKFTEICNGLGYNMPVLIPDEELTSSMPQIKPDKVDQGIFIPGFQDCLNGLKEGKKRP
ncbi:hypothetical protein [Rhodohalobacter mucosus]|uniref:Uncharacterized protein n=1 Tax=Rhodohalobacter mucosus TaxID=2079485 RepID=A0A316TQE0_9BACT|nr:hypothetical protein [Rhodohalobacter mucosus]PWN05891.1 hypothetical protein DDZ15_11945 [Rhodohalobacter mucosus]